MDHGSNHVCGCYFNNPGNRSPRQYLPQVELESHTRITPVCFSTKLKQTFNNPHDQVIPELRYTFPLYDGVSVSGYTIRYGDKTLEGVVKQKEVARQTYQEAVDRGETASLLESLPAGIFGVTVGNLPAKTDVFVDILYNGELKHDAGIDGLRYNLPTAIAPRYGEYPGELLESNAVGKGIKVTVDIDMGRSSIRKTQSPTHPIAITMGNVSTGSSHAFSPSLGSVTLTQGSTELGGDFVLQLLIDDIGKPQAILEKHTSLDSRAIMATMVPKFNLTPSTPEIVFIVDQSGSMIGSKNTALVAALQVFLKSLPFGVRFNIYAFGSTYKSLWPKSQAYSEYNLKKAIRYVRTFEAQLGGTQMYEPIEQVFINRLSDLSLEVMLLTDGEFWQEQRLFDLIKEKVHTDDGDARVFTLGIGSDVSHTLCEGIARAGDGFAQFIVDNEETDAKVLRMLRASLYPHIKDYSLEINFDDRDEAADEFELIEKINNDVHTKDVARSAEEPDANPSSFFSNNTDVDPPVQEAGRYAHLPKIAVPSILQIPNSIPPLFPYNRTSLYLMLGPDAPQKEIVSVTLRAQAPSGPIELTIPVHTTSSGTVIHQLAARKAVQELEEGRGWIQQAKTTGDLEVKTKYESRLAELAEREAVRLGETFQVAGKWCSFVAVAPKLSESMEQCLHDTKAFNTSYTFNVAFDDDEDGSDEDYGFCIDWVEQDKETEEEKEDKDLVSGPRLRRSGGQNSDDNMDSTAPVPEQQAILLSENPSAEDKDDEETHDIDMDWTAVLPDQQAHLLFENPSAVLRAVIDLQTFSGHWQWCGQLLKLIDIRDSSAPGLGPNEISATALVLAFFEKNMTSLYDVWDMVAQKARSWLASQVTAEEVDKLVVNAKGMLS